MLDTKISVVADVETALEIIQNRHHLLKTIVLDAGTHGSVSLLSQLRMKSTYSDIAIFIAGLYVDKKLNAVKPQIVGMIDANAETSVFTNLIQQVLGDTDKELSTHALNALKEKSAGRRILIVEHDLQKCAHLKQILSVSGYEVNCALNGNQAIDMVFGNKPDIIFLNIDMPEIENQPIVAHLRQDELTQNIPIILTIDEPNFALESGIAILGEYPYLHNVRQYSQYRM